MVFGLSRVVIFGLAGVFSDLLPYLAPPGFRGAFSQWDGEWYLRIVQEGYWYRGPMVQAPVAFFPLYPLLAKGLTFLGLSAWAAFFSLTNLAAAGFMVIFWELIKREWGEKAANLAVVFYAFGPLSYLFSAFYAEALFMWLACLCFLALGEKRFYLAAAWAGLAAATRPLGILLAVPVVGAFWFQSRKPRMEKVLVLAGISVSGLVAYSGYLWLKFGRPFLFAELEATAWHRFWSWPGKTLLLFFLNLISLSWGDGLWLAGLFDLVMALGFLFLLVYGTVKRRIKPVYLVFLWLGFGMALSKPWSKPLRGDVFLLSAAVGRYLFQVGMILAGFWAAICLKRPWLKSGTVFLNGILMVVLAVMFFNGFWVE